MAAKFARLVLTDSAYRHGFGLRHVREVLSNRPLVLRSRRGVENGYDVLGKAFGGDYLEIVGTVIQREKIETFRVFHIARMRERDRRRYERLRRT